jgi:predicted dehydrogenase
MTNKPSQAPMMNSGLSRRRLLRSSAAAAAISIVPRHVLGQGQIPPSEKLNFGCVGAGGRAASDMQELASENFAALCDVDERSALGMFKKYPKAKQYKDFRKMLDEEKGIDAVLVATPDHVHAVATIAAVHHGKHVYCEKPLTRTIFEARQVRLAAKEAKVVTQMGNQGMAFEGNRLLNEWIWAGAIGPVREVHVWSDRPTHKGTKGLYWQQGIDRPKETPPVPEGLDWDLWLGPAPERPYNPIYVPFKWRGWWDFGSGGLGDMGIHNLAPVFSAMKLEAPLSVCASSTPVYEETVPMASMVHYEFAARGEMPAMKLHWYDGGMLPARPDELEDGRELNKEDGALFIGDKGKILVEGWGGASPRLIPETKMQEFKRPPKTLPRSIGHHKEFIEACKGRGTTRSNFDFAGPLTEAVLLGSICTRAGGGKLTWDPVNLKTNSDLANRYIHYEYRKGWTL